MWPSGVFVASDSDSKTFICLFAACCISCSWTISVVNRHFAKCVLCLSVWVWCEFVYISDHRCRRSIQQEGQKVAISRQTATSVRHRSLWVRKIESAKFQFCPRISPKFGILATNFVLLNENFTTKRKFSDKLKLTGGGGGNWHCFWLPTFLVNKSGI